MKAINSLNDYGYKELQNVYERNMTIALITATVLHLMFTEFYRYIDSLSVHQNKQKSVKERIIDIGNFQPPIGDYSRGGIINEATSKFVQNAKPVPVENAKVDTNVEFPSQTYLSNVANIRFTEATEALLKGELVIPPDNDNSEIKQIAQVEKPPVPVIAPSPEYPVLAIKANLEGEVVVKLLVDRAGKVKKTEVQYATDEIFIEPALNVAKNWVFTPAIMNGKSVPVWVAVPFKFKLK